MLYIYTYNAYASYNMQNYMDKTYKVNTKQSS